MRIHRVIFSHTCAQAKLRYSLRIKIHWTRSEQTIKTLADETDSLLESNKALAAEIKVASAGDLRNSDSRLAHEISNTRGRVGEDDGCADGC